MKPISFVIITYNRPDDALELAQNISALDGLDELVEEVVIVNNRSTVSYEALEVFIAAHPAIPYRYVVAPENLGVSRGRNYAISLSKAPILFFLDDDALLRNKDALRYILPIFGIAGFAASGAIMTPPEPPDADSAPSESSDSRPVGIAAFKVYYSSTGEMQINAFPHKRFAEYKDTPHFDAAYFSGCAHAIRRSVFEQVGVYPENFFYGMEEYDLSYRTLNAGYSIRYDHRVTILHKESPAGRLTPKEKLRGMWVNKSKVAWKYLPLPYFFTTALLWSLEYVKKSGGNIGGFFKGWGQIAGIPGIEKRAPVGKTAIAYLRRAKARLWY
ncbi:MAG TPA: glycosyltransferase family 2 protein [Puia sp.]|jgi:GT2 family glycosyltransferase|nr:glycosyltransferase family 2 protein [Puia sp.]